MLLTKVCALNCLLNLTEKNEVIRIIFPGYDEIAQLLIDHDAELNSVDFLGMAPIHYACDTGHEKIVEMLCNRDAVTNITDPLGGQTPFHFAAIKGNI